MLSGDNKRQSQASPWIRPIPKKSCDSRVPPKSRGVTMNSAQRLSLHPLSVRGRGDDPTDAIVLIIFRFKTWSLFQFEFPIWNSDGIISSWILQILKVSSKHTSMQADVGGLQKIEKEQQSVMNAVMSIKEKSKHDEEGQSGAKTVLGKKDAKGFLLFL